MHAARLALVLFLPLSLHAGVGQSLPVVEKAYGGAARVLKKDAETLQVGYVHDGFVVSVTYVGGTSVREGYAKVDLGKLTEEDVKKLLALSSAGEGGWREVEIGDQARYWVSGDSKLVASLSPEKNFLLVQEKKQPEASR